MISLKDVKDAKERMTDIAYLTPILQLVHLSKICGNRLFLKSEHLQKTGSFKIRGASNKVINAAENGVKYVTAASSGNHGQAVAYVANKYEIPATIVVPENVSTCKVNAIQAYNGRVEMCGTTSGERLQREQAIAVHENGVYICSYDDSFNIDCVATCGLT